MTTEMDTISYIQSSSKKVIQVEQRGISILHTHDILVRMISSPINPSGLIPMRKF